MNNETVTPDFNTRQEVNHTESSISSVPLSRGIEIAPSAALSSRFFHGPGRVRSWSSRTTDDRDWAERVARVLR
jgi:hypothetical protein